MSQLQERIAQFRKMASDDPDNELGHFRLGQLLMEAGQLEVMSEVVGLKQLLTGCVEEIGPLARHKTQRVVVKARADVSVRSDSRRLRQVILNLLSNAIKFTPEGGVVTLETERDGARC